MSWVRVYGDPHGEQVLVESQQVDSVGHLQISVRRRSTDVWSAPMPLLRTEKVED